MALSRPRRQPGDRLLPLALCLAAAACSAAPPAAQIPAGTAVPPASPAAIAAEMTREQAAAAQEGKGCEALTRPREAAFCYHKSEDEASIAPLFALGRTLAVEAEKHPVSAWPDFLYAAENAGLIAAKTRETRLHAGASSENEIDQIFALQALRHMLASLRWGHAHGKGPDESVRKERLPRVHAACLDKLRARSGKLALAAGDCLKEVHDPADTAVLVEAAVSHPDLGAQRYLLEIAAGFGPVPKASLPRLVPILEKPLAEKKWTQDEVWLRATACRILLRDTTASDPWARQAGETAAREIGNRSSQAREPCDALGRRAP